MQLVDKGCKHFGEPNAILLRYLQLWAQFLTGTPHDSSQAGKKIMSYA